MNIRAWKAITNAVPLLVFFVLGLTLILGNPCFWLFGDPLFIEQCWLAVDNQSGKTLYVTPLQANGNIYTNILLLRTTWPLLPAFQQRSIPVKSGEQVSMSFSCDTRVSVLNLCDSDGECYVYTRPYERATIRSLEALARPDAAVEAAVRSAAEHNYRGVINTLLCIIQIIAVFSGFYWLQRLRVEATPVEIKEIDRL